MKPIYELKYLLKPSVEKRIQLNSQVSSVWYKQPCGMEFVTGEDLTLQMRSLLRLRMKDYPEIFKLISRVSHKVKRVLKLGWITGIDSLELICRGALLTSVNIGSKSCQQSELFFRQAFLELQLNIINTSSHSTELPSNSFALIYSNGSIHHSPMFPEICNEINRALIPGGQAIIMVYRKPSIMYLQACMGRSIDYHSPVSLFLKDSEFLSAMSHLRQLYRENYYFLRPHVRRLGNWISSRIESILGKYYGACQLICLEKLLSLPL
jgi:SAM-dependent methyltransferase